MVAIIAQSVKKSERREALCRYERDLLNVPTTLNIFTGIGLLNIPF